MQVSTTLASHGTLESGGSATRPGAAARERFAPSVVLGDDSLSLITRSSPETLPEHPRNIGALAGLRQVIPESAQTRTSTGHIGPSQGSAFKNVALSPQSGATVFVASALNSRRLLTNVSDSGQRLQVLKNEMDFWKAAIEALKGNCPPNTSTGRPEAHMDLTEHNIPRVTGRPRRASSRYARTSENGYKSTAYLENPSVQKVLQGIKDHGPGLGAQALGERIHMSKVETKRIIRNFGLSTKALRQSWLSGEYSLPKARPIDSDERNEILQYRSDHPTMGIDELARQFKRQYKQILDLCRNHSST